MPEFLKGGYVHVPANIGHTRAELFHRLTLGEQAFSDIHRTIGDAYCDTQCQYFHIDNTQLIDQSISPVFDPYAQSNVQESQCGFNDYTW